MKELVDSQKKKQIIGMVQSALDRHQPRKYRVTVDEVVEDDDWYHVVVVAENDQRDRDFYDALEEAENELTPFDGHRFLLVPVVGD